MMMRKLFAQMMKFGIAGIVSMAVDFVVFSVLDRIRLDYIVSNIISYACSMMANYWMSMNFVFVRKEDWSRQREFMVFVLLGAAGMHINTVSLWLFYDVIYENSIVLKLWAGEGMAKFICKIGAAVILLFYNFVSRKIFLEKRN